MKLLNSGASLNLKTGSSLLLALAVMTACSLPKPSKDSKDSGATFAVTSQEASFTTVTNDATYAVPNAKTLSEKACIVDIQYGRPVLNHHFTISGLSGADQDVVSDASGCLVWKDKIAYNHLAQAAYVEARTTLTANGYQQGARTISYAINPWEGQALSLKDSEVTDLKTGDDAKAALQGLDVKTKQLIKHPLWLQNAMLTVLPKQLSGNGTGFSFEFQAMPIVLTKDINNQDKAISLFQGKFNVKLSLIRVINSGKQETRQIFAQSPLLAVDSLFNQQIDVNNVFRVPGGCSLQQWDMAVEITPLNALPGMQEFHGVYSLGNCEAIQSKQSLNLLSSREFQDNGLSTFKVSTFATTTGTTGPVTVYTAGHLSPNGGGIISSGDGASADNNLMQSSITVGQLTTSPIGTVPASPNSQIVKKRVFALNFCLHNSTSIQAVRTSSLKVTGLSGDLGKVNSYDNGCFQVTDSVNYSYFEAECWVPKQIRIQSDELGLDAKINVEVNAVNENSAVLMDTRYDHPAFPCAQGTTKFVASQYSFDKKEYSYKISDTLALTINKTGVLQMNLSLQRPALIGAGALPMSLPIGDYQLRWVVVDTTLKDYSQAYGKVYAAGQKIVNIGANSKIQEAITISSTNLKSIGNNSYLLFELLPTETNPEGLKGFQNVTFRAPFQMSNNYTGAGMEELKGQEPPEPGDQLQKPVPDLGYSVVASLTAQFNRDQQENEMLDKRYSTKEYFAGDTGLTLINLNKDQSPFKDISVAQLKDWLSKGTAVSQVGKVGPTASFVSALCAHWVSNVMSQQLHSGKQSPIDKYINSFTRKEHTVWGDWSAKQDTIYSLTYSCETAEEQHPGSFFTVNYHYMVDKPTLQGYRLGEILDFGVGQSVGLSSSYSFSTSHSVSAGAGVKVGFSPGGGGADPTMPAAMPSGGSAGPSALGIGGGGSFGAFSAGADVGYSFSSSWSQSSSVGESIGLDTGIGAKIEKNILAIRAADYEKCAVITMNANQVVDVAEKLHTGHTLANALYRFFAEGEFQQVLADSSTDEQMELANRGYMICMGEKAGRPLVFNEHYYIVNQSVSTANNLQTTDAGDDRNRMFFFALRGDSDYMGAMEFIQNNAAMPKAYEDQYHGSYLSKDPYKLMFSRTLRNYPGHFISPF